MRDLRRLSAIALSISLRSYSIDNIFLHKSQVGVIVRMLYKTSNTHPCTAVSTTHLSDNLKCGLVRQKTGNYATSFRTTLEDWIVCVSLARRTWCLTLRDFSHLSKNRTPFLACRRYVIYTCIVLEFFFILISSLQTTTIFVLLTCTLHFIFVQRPVRKWTSHGCWA